jgi:peroxiredoxin
MAAVNSQMLPLGTPAPSFSLTDTDGNTVSLDDGAGAKAYLVMFICNHCPYVIHVADELAAVSSDYADRGVAMFGISSNDVAKYPADSLPKMAEEKALRGYQFPYLLDDSQDVAKAYKAACTPDLYLFDADRKLVYRGQLDGSRPNNGIPVTGGDLRAALDAVLGGADVSADQVASIGCNIKWKPGNAPEYFG